MRLVETLEYQKGAAAEEAAYRAWIRDEYYVMRTRDYTTAVASAPRLHHYQRPLTFPDFLLFKNRRRLWVDVKAKEHPLWFRALQRHEHGIDLRLARDYLAVESETATPFWILFYERENDRWLGRRLTELMAGDDKRIYQGTNHLGMANFPIASLQVVDPSRRGAFDALFFPGGF